MTTIKRETLIFDGYTVTYRSEGADLVDTFSSLAKDMHVAIEQCNLKYQIHTGKLGSKDFLSCVKEFRTVEDRPSPSKDPINHWFGKGNPLVVLDALEKTAKEYRKKCIENGENVAIVIND